MNITILIKHSKEQALANKQYISIIRLFNYCDISTGKNFNVSRVRKQLQAEFGITQSGFIEVDGYTYTRQDIFEEIEHPDFPRRLEFHKEIWSAPELLQLLEDYTFNSATIRDGFRSFWNNREFEDFLSPYIVGPFHYVSRTLLAGASMAEMSELLRFEDFLKAPEREEAFRPLRIFLDENLRLLRNTNRENYKIMRSKISHWIDSDWHGLFNNLPGEYYDIKNDLIVQLVNIGVAIQKKYRSDCRQISEQLVALEDLQENLRGTILSNHTAYTGTSNSINFRGYWWVGWVVFMVVKALASGGCEHTSNDYPESPEIRLNMYQTDSLIRKFKDSSKANSIDTSILRSLHKEELH
jgi:hypothetical protein